MPHRVVHLLELLLGLMAVAFLMLIGADLYLSSRRGPAWKRRWVSTGMSFLLLLGVLSCGAPATESQSEPPDESGAEQDAGKAGNGLDPGEEPDATGEEKASAPLKNPALEQWEAFLSLWRSYEKKALEWGAGTVIVGEEITELNESLGASIDALVIAELLGREQGRLLKAELEALRNDLLKVRPAPPENVSCYIILPNYPTDRDMDVPLRMSVDMLQSRLPLLERLAKSRRLRPEVLEKILLTTEAHLHTLSKPDNLEKLPEEDRPKIDKLRKKVSELLAVIRNR